MASRPCVSVVVPSFNQGAFLEECLESLAHYPADVCEILVMDGGSTDGSVNVIRKYQHRLAHWQSRADGGQAAALREGFRLARGSIFGWLNSDDRLIDGALRTVIEFFGRNPSIQWAYGDHDFIDGEGRRLSSRYVAAMDYRELYWGDRYLPQEAVFYPAEPVFHGWRDQSQPPAHDGLRPLAAHGQAGHPRQDPCKAGPIPPAFRSEDQRHRCLPCCG